MYIRASNSNHIFRKEIMHRSGIRGKFLRERTWNLRLLITNNEMSA